MIEGATMAQGAHSGATGAAAGHGNMAAACRVAGAGAMAGG